MSEERIINIHELNLDIIKPSSKIVAIGKPGSGKSTLIASVLYNKRHLYPVAQIFSGTESSTGFFKQYVPELFIYNELDTDALEAFVKRQKLAKEYLDNPFALLVVDDCTDDPKVLNRPLFQNLYKNGRHYNMLFILSLQYALDVRPNIRNNIDGTFIFRESNISTRKKIWENFAGVIPDFKTFCKIMDDITGDYTALYIHNQSTSNKLEDCVFYYKAPLNIPAYRWFGCEHYRSFNSQRYNIDYKSSVI